jgi:leader peptidase (prepilin peptidase)/N-methyltransferase
MLLALVGALLGWKGVFVSLFGGSVVGSVIGITVVLSRRRDADESEEAAQPSLGGTELPFGPFLAIAAVFYLFAEPWIQLHFRFASG